MKEEPARLAAAVGEGMRMQVMLAGGIFCGFALLGRPLVGAFFGSDWEAVFLIFPMVALGWMAAAAYDLHVAALYALGRNGDVATFYLANVGLLATFILLLAPKFGILGYGYAEIAAVAAYPLLQRALSRAIGAIECATALTWLACFAIALFGAELGPVCLVGLLGVAAHPDTRRFLAGGIRQMRNLARA
jgi:O-antigen/teichoic acid export membrane protein